MGCRIIEGHEAGSNIELVCFYNSVTGIVFGPTMNNVDQAKRFIGWLEQHDPRLYPVSELLELYDQFCREERDNTTGGSERECDTIG